MVPSFNAHDEDVLVTYNQSKVLTAISPFNAERVQDDEGRTLVAAGKVGAEVMYVVAPGTTTSAVVKLEGAAFVFEVVLRLTGPAKGKRAAASASKALTEADLVALASK